MASEQRELELWVGLSMDKVNWFWELVSDGERIANNYAPSKRDALNSAINALRLERDGGA